MLRSPPPTPPPPPQPTSCANRPHPCLVRLCEQRQPTGYRTSFGRGVSSCASSPRRMPPSPPRAPHPPSRPVCQLIQPGIQPVPACLPPACLPCCTGQLRQADWQLGALIGNDAAVARPAAHGPTVISVRPGPRTPYTSVVAARFSSTVGLTASDAQQAFFVAADGRQRRDRRPRRSCVGVAHSSLVAALVVLPGDAPCLIP